MIAAIVVSAVITMELSGTLIGAFGTFWGTVATGAVAGFASGVIMTGSLKGGLAGAMWGAVGAFATYTGAELAGRLAGVVNSAAAHTASLLKSGLTKLTAIKTLLHGLSSGIINYFRGGSFRAGFFSGLGSAFDIGTKGYGTMVGRTSIMAIIGGTFAKLGGGKFANGALSGAFTHLFNAETGSIIKTYKAFKKGCYKFGDFLARVSGFRDWQNESVVLDNYYREQAVGEVKELYRFSSLAIEHPKMAIEAYRTYNNYRYIQLETDTVIKGYVSTFAKGGIPMMISSVGNLLGQAHDLNLIISSNLPK